MNSRDMDTDSDVFPTLPASRPVARDARSIGAVLVDAGRLSIEDAERISQLQRQKNLRFGDAGRELGLLTAADIDFALARQFDFPYLQRGQSTVSEEVVAAYAPFAPPAESLRGLRSQLLIRWFDSDPPLKALAIVSGERKEGRSFIAANLAVVFSQLGERTLLIDADMQNPRQHQLFGIDGSAGLSGVLAGRVGLEVVQRIPMLRNLSVLPAGVRPPNPQELLGRAQFPQLLQQLASRLDVILLDTPAASETADAQIIAVRAGAALIVARKNAARKWHVQGASDAVAQAKATVIGAVLNSY
jgi:protein-tyrosine kinase